MDNRLQARHATDGGKISLQGLVEQLLNGLGFKEGAAGNGSFPSHGEQRLEAGVPDGVGRSGKRHIAKHGERPLFKRVRQAPPDRVPKTKQLGLHRGFPIGRECAWDTG